MMLRYETEDILKLVVSRREKAGNFASKRREKAGNSLLVLVRTPCSVCPSGLGACHFTWLAIAHGLHSFGGGVLEVRHCVVLYTYA